MIWSIELVPTEREKKTEERERGGAHGSSFYMLLCKSVIEDNVDLEKQVKPVS
jgi:hypothetical protein